MGCYEYAFDVRTAPGYGHCEAVQHFIEHFVLGRCCDVFTEDGFTVFRRGMYQMGLELVDIERVPYQEPEEVE